MPEVVAYKSLLECKATVTSGRKWRVPIDKKKSVLFCKVNFGVQASFEEVSETSRCPI